MMTIPITLAVNVSDVLFGAVEVSERRSESRNFYISIKENDFFVPDLGNTRVELHENYVN